MSSPTCPNCHTPVKPGAKFCRQCGRALGVPPQNASSSGGVTCSQCGARNRAGAKFCSKCRNDLPLGASAAGAPNVSVKCPQCGALNRAGAKFCAKCRSDLNARAALFASPKVGAAREANRWRIPAFAIGFTVIAMLCMVFGALAWIGRDGGTKIAGGGASTMPSVVASTPIPATRSPGSPPSVPPPTPRPTRAPDATLAPTSVASDWVNYANATGAYALRYPPAWSGIEIGGDAGFELPNDFFVEILIDRAAPGKTVAEYARDRDWLGSAVVQASAPARVGDENAIRLQVAERGATQMTAVLYIAIHNGQIYLFSLRGVYGRAPTDMSGAIGQFDEFVKSFRFTR